MKGYIDISENKWIDNWNLKWGDKLNVMMILLISEILKINDKDEIGYRFENMEKEEFKNLICNQIIEMDYNEKMKKLLSDLFKILSEYGE